MARASSQPSPDAILALQLADVAYVQAQRALERAKDQREAVRARYRRRFPDGEWVEVDGIRIRRKVNKGGRTFSLTKYETAHGEITPEMEACTGRAQSSETWTIEDVVA
jgi:hypothetical protein